MLKTGLLIVGSAAYAVVAIIVAWWLYAYVIEPTSSLTAFIGLLVLLLAIAPILAYLRRVSWHLILAAELFVIIIVGLWLFFAVRMIF